MFVAFLRISGFEQKKSTQQNDQLTVFYVDSDETGYSLYDIQPIKDLLFFFSNKLEI